MFKKKSNRIFYFCAVAEQSVARQWVMPRIFCALAICLMGCHSVPKLPPADLSDGGWTLHQGQVVWSAKRGAPEIAGDLVLATNAEGRAFVQFTKTPVPFLVAQSTTNSWQLHSVPDNRTYSGRGKPPVRAIWLWLPRCLAGATPPKPLIWERRDNADWRLQNSVTGEFLEGYLSP
jgi:hypothetical protein